jgi:protein involved in polysaccharide export with SLBB domain
MTKELVLLFFLFSGVCAAQTTLTTPVADVQQNPDDSSMPNSVRTQPYNYPQTNGRYGGVPDLSRDATDTYPTPYSVPSNRTTPGSNRIVGPLRTKSEFQQYAEDATGRRLPVYGRQLFDQVPSTFAPVENVPVPADYVLGPDDQLLIRAWGKIELNTRVTVDRNGQINLPRVGTINIAGIRYSQVESYLKSAIGAMFKDFELNVTVGRLRTIQIYVLGNARQPGSYTVSSLSTLVDALFTSGGPSATGTMRDIQLRRDGKIITDFDLYDLVAKGDKSKDVRLSAGDVIFIPPIGPQIAISGDINMPGIFEIKGDTTVGSALEAAGGITSMASAERAVLERIENHSNRTVQEFALDAQGQARAMKDGDLIRVFPLSPKFQDAVTLRGNVAVPGLYPWKEGMRISDLIPSRSALITRDFWNRQNHLVRPISERPFAAQRMRPLASQNPDASNGSPPGEMNGPEGLQLGQRNAGSVGRYSRNGSEMPNDQAGVASPIGQNQSMSASENRRLGDGVSAGGEDIDDGTGNSEGVIGTIGKNSAEINWEYAVIERLDEHDLSTRLIPFRLAGAVDFPNSADNQVLKAGDVVTIFSRADLELPMEKHSTFVRIGGEVSAPGVYRVNPGETLRDVVKRAGGLTQHSYLYAAVFTRVSTREAQEKELLQSTDQMQRELMARYANATPQTGLTAADQQAQLAMQQAALARLTAIKPTGRVVLAMNPNAESVADIPEFPLEDGDSYFIPPRMGTVQVAGAVYNANAFRYEPGERLIRYLNAAGGATREADAKRMFVIRADGSVISRQSRNSHSHGSYQNLKLLPGDAIIVPDKLRISSKMTQFLQLTQLSSQLALTAAALNIIR